MKILTRKAKRRLRRFVRGALVIVIAPVVVVKMAIEEAKESVE